MQKIFDILTSAEKAARSNNEGRIFGLMFAIVTNNQDPMNMRRVKVTLESKGGQTQTDWALAMRLIPNYDPPMPAIGTSVIVAAIDGDPHDLVWLGPVVNNTNPQDGEQSDPLNDNSQTIPGASSEAIGKSWSFSTGEDWTGKVGNDMEIDIEKTCTIKNSAGASITLHESGFLVLQDAWGRKLTWGGAGGTEYKWDMAGAEIDIVNPSSFKINGKEIATVGAVDSRGDALVNRGW
jgi:hypothetical protein